MFCETPVCDFRPPSSDVSDMAEKVARSLERHRRSLVDLAAEEVGFVSDHVDVLFDDTLRFLRNIGVLLRDEEKRLALDQELISALSPNATLANKPLGKVLVVVPSNAPLPLAIILPMALVASGNSVSVTSASRVSKITEQLVSHLLPHTNGRVEFRPGSARRNVNAALDDGSIDALYFLGSSEHYSSIASRCAERGIELIYEGQGNTVALVLGRDSVERSVQEIVQSKVMWNGWMCSAPNVVVVHADFRAQFMGAFNESARKIELQSSIQKLVTTTTCEYVEAVLSDSKKSDSVLESHTPQLVEARSLDRALQHELFGPVGFVLAYDDWDKLVAELRQLRHRLQLSIFSNSELRIRRLIEETLFSRYCVNSMPSAQDPLLPWGCRGRSGNSQVNDFVQKGRTRAIIESDGGVMS